MFIIIFFYIKTLFLNDVKLCKKTNVIKKLNGSPCDIMAYLYCISVVFQSVV